MKQLNFKLIFSSFLEAFFWIGRYLRAFFKRQSELAAENVLLRGQLSLAVREKKPKRRPTPVLRMVFVFFSKRYSDWEKVMAYFKPATVIGWYNTAFKFYWIWRSRNVGRPKISPKTIALIKRIYKENPLISPEKIHEQLINLNVTDAPSPPTIAKYCPKIRKPPSEKRQQSWKTFLANHIKGIWAMDFFVVPTITFKILYVLIVFSHDRRKIEHFAVTANPFSAWVIQQMREATPFGEIPEYLIHDNDSTFTAKSLQDFLVNSNIKSKKTSFRSPWQNGYCERAIGTLRRELLDHIIPLNEKHLEYLLGEYVRKYYHPVRTHQGIGKQTPIPSVRPPATKMDDTVLISEPILGGLYHSYKKVA